MRNISFFSRSFATVVLALGALLPSVSFASKVGWYGTCYGEDPSSVITAAGDTPVRLSALDAASLSGIKTLFVGSCDFSTTPDVDAAVSNGMSLIVHAASGNFFLPGATVPRSSNGGTDIDFTLAALPFLNGPGGELGNASLDGGGWSNHGSVAEASLPQGALAYATTGVGTEVVTFGYAYGRGRVVASTIPLGCYLSVGRCGDLDVAPRMQSYATNVIAWLAPSFTTCANEGYTGTKLTMCRKVCESNLSGTTLNAMIRLYVAAYREQPACAF